MNRTDVCPTEFATACVIESIRQTLPESAL